MAIPVTDGSGTSSVATETIATLKYQQIKVVSGVSTETNAWGVTSANEGKVTTGASSVITTQLAGSVMAVSGSFSPAANQSVSGAVTAPPGSVMTVNQLAGSVLAVSGSFTPAANQSVSGAVTAPPGSVATVVFPAGSVTAVTFAAAANQSVSGAITAPPGSVMTVATLAGSILAVSGATTTTAGSIISTANPAGSVTGVRTDLASVITVWQNSSVLAVPVGSIITTFSQGPSIVGTYAEDAAHTTADKGVFALAVRNDLQPSITSADGDYSPLAVGPTGALTAHDAPITQWVQGTADLRVVLGTSVVAIAAQGASVFTYIREVQIANMGSASVLVTIGGGLGSILGYTIAPAGGGSNYITRLKTGANSAVTASISGTASVLVTMTGFTAKI